MITRAMSAGERIAGPVAAYARLIHERAGGEHHVASATGAWLLLALCGREARGARSERLKRLLGMEPETAAEIASTLLDSPHPAIRAAAALWVSPQFSARLAGFVDDLPLAVARGPIPSRFEADRWTAEKTEGLIDGFPQSISPEASLVAANAFATKVTWARPFELAPATELGRDSRWTRELRRALRTPPGDDGHAQFIAHSAIGDVAVHAATAKEGVRVISVLGPPDADYRDVIAAAYDVARRLSFDEAVGRRSLFDLPLGDGPLGTIRERRVRAAMPVDSLERCWAVLPSWWAISDHDLGSSELGFLDAAASVAALADAPLESVDAAQVAMAKYTRFGFESAAVSAMSMPLGAAFGAPPRHQVVQRVAELRFGRPFAVVAVGSRDDAWRGVPLFSAWVTSAIQLDDEDDPLADDLLESPSGEQFLVHRHANADRDIVMGLKVLGLVFGLFITMTAGSLFYEGRVTAGGLVEALTVSGTMALMSSGLALAWMKSARFLSRLFRRLFPSPAPRRPPPNLT